MNKITQLFFLCFSVLAFGQGNLFKSYDELKGKSETKILYDRVYGISKLTEVRKTPVTADYFKQAYHEIQRADYLKRLPLFEKLKAETQLGLVKKYIPLSILVTDFESINASRNTADAFEKHEIALVAPLVGHSKSNTLEFILKSDLIFNTTNKTITSIAIRFNENDSWKTIVANQPFKKTVDSQFNNTIAFRLTFANGQVIEQAAEINIDKPKTHLAGKNAHLQSPAALTTINSTIAYQGYDETQAHQGQGQYEIFYGGADQVLDKPIILVDGFDPTDSRDIPLIYSLLDYGANGNLADDLRTEGFDIVILNLPNYTRPGTTTLIQGGGDYIQRNAMVLVELLNQINAMKVGTEKNVVIGPSMGGLISRYALRYMEMNNMDPDTRLYISFDAPHLGANVPIGLQHLFNYMAYGPLGDVTVQGVVDGLLKSAAAREMLIDHYEGHLAANSLFEFNNAVQLPTGKPGFRNAFQTELNSMGFPQTVRNVSIANGSGNGSMNGTPDMEVMNHTFNVTSSQRAIINLRFTPTTNATNQVSRFRGQANVFVWFTVYESLANAKSPTYTAGLDSAPGGKFDMASFAGGIGDNPILSEFFDNLQINYFDFIPTNSSLAVSSTTNLYTPITATTATPFAAQYVPTANENHVTLTAGNVAFALNEILNPVLATAAVDFSGLQVQNPIGNIISMYSDQPIFDATLTLTDISGKNILTKSNQQIEGNYQIPVAVSNGVYFLTIANEKASITKKLVKN